MKPILAAMLSVSGMVLTDAEKRLLARANPLGVSLFKHNVRDKRQVKALIRSIKEVIGRDDVLIAVDQEGGSVCRFGPPKWPQYLSQYALGSLKGREGDELTRLHGALIGADLKKLGVNWNYAPVLDVRYANTTTALANRIFSDDEKLVAKRGQILLKAYQAQGICSCVKHLPGHGRAQVDPHLHLPILTQSIKTLAKDFYPFKALADQAVAGMTAHIVIAEVDDKPVTQSAKAIQEIIRGRIGFKGFLISDAIDMMALKGTLTERVQSSLEAGCDAICYCFGIEDELREVVKAARPLTEEAMDRFFKIRDIILKPSEPLDQVDAYARYRQLAGKTKSLKTDYDAVEVLHQMREAK